jgi:3-oxo-5alpha-steroid 4-dehydrogenase
MARSSDSDWHSQVRDPIVVVDDTHWDDEADIVVVGFGGAGACAAIQAAQLGASVIAIDRFQGGGATAMSGGVCYAGGGTPQQKRAGCQDDAEEMYRYLSIETQGVVSDQTLREFCDSSVENLTWLEKLGLEFGDRLSPVKTSYPAGDCFLYYSGNEPLPVNAERARPAPRGHRHKARGQAGFELFRRLRQATLREGVTPKLATAVERLVVNPAGEVLGVEGLEMEADTKQTRIHVLFSKLLIQLRTYGPSATPLLLPLMEKWERAKRRPRLIRARHGVILATGGFVQNKGMMQQYLPKYRGGLRIGGPGCDGSGIRLGESAGGTTGVMDHASAWRFINPPPAFVHGIIVDTHGERFCNEAAYGAQIGYFMCEERNGKAWLILNQALFDQARSQCGPGKSWYFQWLPALLTMYFSRKKGETIEDLARACGMSAEKLRSSIETYNEAAAGKTEDPFRKAEEFSTDISRGPYYALDISLDSNTIPCAVITFGGLVVDERTGQVKRQDGSGISGLYAAGRTAVGIPSNHYVSGLAIADCVSSGRRAARSALDTPRRTT